MFGLGAILCEILTGKPPYAAKDRMQVYRLASGAMLDRCFARLDACGADGDLVDLARRCLAPRPQDRPGDAGEVSASVTKYLETVQQRLKETEIERAEAQTRAEEEQKRREVEQAKACAERQKRRVTLALAASLLLLAAGAGLASWWYAQDRARPITRAGEVDGAATTIERGGHQHA